MISATDMESLAARLGLPFIARIDDSGVDTALLGRLPLAFARMNLILPLREEDGRLLVAAGDPTNLSALDEVRGLFGLPVEMVITTPQSALEAINQLYSRISGTAQEVVEELEGEDLSTIATELSQPRDLLESEDKATVIPYWERVPTGQG